MGFLQKIGLKTDGKTSEETELQKKISDQALIITKKVLSRKLLQKDIDDLEVLYKKYFKKYPDVAREESANKRIRQLKIMI